MKRMVSVLFTLVLLASTLMAAQSQTKPSTTPAKPVAGFKQATTAQPAAQKEQKKTKKKKAKKGEAKEQGKKETEKKPNL